MEKLCNGDEQCHQCPFEKHHCGYWMEMMMENADRLNDERKERQWNTKLSKHK
jgi:hypothetical protein